MTVWLYLQEGAEQEIERSCREMEELHAVIKAEGMELSDSDRASFLLATADLERLQEAVATAKAGHAQQGSRFTSLLADGECRLQAALARLTRHDRRLCCDSNNVHAAPACFAHARGGFSQDNGSVSTLAMHDQSAEA